MRTPSRSFFVGAAAWLAAALLVAPGVASVAKALSGAGGRSDAEIVARRGALAEVERSMLNHIRPVQSAEARADIVQTRLASTLADAPCVIESVRAGAEKPSFAGLTEQPISIRLRCPPAALGLGLAAIRTLQPAFLIETAAVDASTISPTRTEPLVRVDGSYWVVAPQTAETQP